MGISTNRGRKNFDEINITPLTDIFLVLLIIMMVIAPMLDQQGLKLLVPNHQEAKQIKEQPKIINVDISDNGSISINGNTVSADSLMFRIQDEAKQKKDGLMIQASGNAPHGSVVSVMDAARTAGVTSISVSEK